ncbi:hypothetical protein [Enterococcus casseliflavus]|uniref:hypothetical protein n=1 Tax=Enterococcus casseliflavus TaxID=37734 RepID=UPI00188317F1|nr:hypothetical protein [Enterococcus casseliflavus]MBE9908834.1 hypothetical protein [Enterococcus casseliflavus]
MIYSKYILKVGFKNKLNLIPLLIPIAIMIFLMIMNTQAIKSTGYVPLLKDGIGIMEGALQRQEGILKDEPNLSEQDEKEIAEANTALGENIQLTKQSITLAEEGRWTDSLAIQLKLMEENELHDIENGNIPDNENFAQHTFMKYSAYKQLSKLNAEPQYDGLEMKGTNYVFRMMDSIFPIIFLLCLIALISNVVNSSIIGRIDIEKLFPENPVKFHLKKIAILTLFGLLFYLFFIGAAFVLSSVLNGVGTLQYPINIYDTGFDQTKPLIDIVTRAGILQLLSLLFVISCVYLISILAKSGLTTLFVSTIAILGPIILTGQIAPIAKYLHILPTTYVNSIRVVTNQLAFENKNSLINFGNGMLVLLISNLLIISIILVIKVRSRSREMLLN